jgi:hypothetical protein
MEIDTGRGFFKAGMPFLFTRSAAKNEGRDGASGQESGDWVLVIEGKNEWAAKGCLVHAKGIKFATGTVVPRLLSDRGTDARGYGGGYA